MSGSFLAGYSLLDTLGAGGCGEVYLARHESSGRLVAIKKAHPDDPESAAELAREFSRIASLEHPGVVRAVDFIPPGREGGPSIVFEVAEGLSSEQACRGAGPSEPLAWTAGLAETLDYLHRSGLLHGDLKPAHVFIDERGVPQLIDFGLAREPGTQAAGTAATAAPEVLRGEPCTVASELYSLGATLFYWLFQRYPWGEDPAGRLAAADRRPALPRKEGLPGGAVRLLRELLSPHPAERPRSAREVVTRLEEIGVALPDPAFADPATRAGGLDLVGRRQALERIEGYIAQQHAAHFVVLAGPRGAGHTRLLREAAGLARLAGRRIEFLGSSPGALPLSPRLPARLRLLAEAAPLTVMADDLHHLAPDQAEVLAGLPRRLAGCPGLLVLVAGPVHPGPGWRELPLDPLSREEVGELVRALLPGPPLPAHLATRLASHTAGQPGKIVAILLEAVRRGVVDRVGPAWRLDRFEQMPLARLDPAGAGRDLQHLDARQRKVIEALSAAGAPAELDALATVTGLSLARTAEACRQLVAAGQLFRDARGRLRLGPGRRRGHLAAPDPELHRRWLEHLGKHPPREGVRREERLARLSRHAAWAGRLGLAARLATRAVQALLRRERPDLGAGVLARLPDRETFPPAGRGRLAAAAGEIHLARARPKEAAGAFEEAVAWLRAGGRPREALGALCRLARCLGDLGRAEQALEHLGSIVAQAPPAALAAEAHLEIGVLRARQQKYEQALEEIERALELAPEGSRVSRRARAARGRCLVLVDRLVEAEAELSRARLEAGAHGERQLETALMLAELQAAGRAAHHRRLVDRAGPVHKALADRGDADGLALLHALLADARLALGDPLGAAREAEQGVGWREVHGHRGWLAAAWHRLARIRLHLGDLPEARAAARRGRREARAAGALDELIVGRCLHSRIEIIDGRPAVALRLARGALAAARRSGQALDLCRARVAMARVLIHRGEMPVAASLLREVLAMGEGELRAQAPEALLEARVLAAETAVVVDPARAVTLARQVEQEAETLDLHDLVIEALSVIDRALVADGQEEQARSLRSRAGLRLEALAAGIDDTAAARRLLERPDRRALAERWGARDTQRLDVLYRFVADLNSLRDPREVAETMMDQALTVLGAERGAVVTAREGGEVSLLLARGVEKETAEDALQLSRTVIDRAQGGESVLAVEPASDPRFADSHSVRLFSIRAVICVPLRSKGRLVGALYVDSRDPSRCFSREDLRFLEALADHAALALVNARAFHRLEEENRRLKADLGRRDRLGDLLGHSRKMLEVYRLLEAAAASDLPVLIHGESGTGKELAARTLHRLDARREGTFVAVNCAALPEPIFEATLFGHEKGAYTGAETSRTGLLVEAHRGTLFLDEITELPLGLQAKLLRVLEDKRVRPLGSGREMEVDFRVVTASRQDLGEAVREGRFRQDLLYRLDVLRVALPPLRERLEDLPLLIDHLLERLSGSFGRVRIHPAVVPRLASWNWPGNVRELENTLSRLALHATEGTIDLKTLEADPELAERFGSTPSDETQLEEVEARAIRRALELTGGHRLRAAQLLGIGRATLFRKIRRYHLEAVGRRPPGGKKVSP
ncbi:MAG: sigma 54-interacting transcriptional regulator [Acidobacteriota bacterium]|nr:sigma 54-interacting transcriptional regulator [Acidobacteriota bacterium]